MVMATAAGRMPAAPTQLVMANAVVPEGNSSGPRTAIRRRIGHATAHFTGALRAVLIRGPPLVLGPIASVSTTTASTAAAAARLTAGNAHHQPLRWEATRTCPVQGRRRATVEAMPVTASASRSPAVTGRKTSPRTIRVRSREVAPSTVTKAVRQSRTYEPVRAATVSNTAAGSTRSRAIRARNVSRAWHRLTARR